MVEENKDTLLLILIVLICFTPVLFMAYKVQYAKDRIISHLEGREARNIDITSVSLGRLVVYFDVEYTSKDGDLVKKSGMIHGLIIPNGEIYWRNPD